MKATLVYKGGSGSGDFGHSGRPGLVGGSSSSGTASPAIEAPQSNKYSTMSFMDASDAVIQDVIAGIFESGWKKYSDSAKIDLPEGGYAKIFKIKEHYVTGKYVAGTQDQQRYRVMVVLRTFRPKPSVDNPNKMDRWDSKELWGKGVRPEGVNAAEVAQQKKLESILKRIVE